VTDALSLFILFEFGHHLLVLLLLNGELILPVLLISTPPLPLRRTGILPVLQLGLADSQRRVPRVSLCISLGRVDLGTPVADEPSHGGRLRETVALEQTGFEPCILVLGLPEALSARGHAQTLLIGGAHVCGSCGPAERAFGRRCL